MQTKPYSEGIIRPVRYKRDPHLGPVALMVMLPRELKRLVREAGAAELRFSDTPLYKLYQSEDKILPPVTLAGPFVGAPHAVIGLEKLIVLGASKIWVMGWCGSLQPDLNIGDLVVPIHAVSEEGTSRHYPAPGEKFRSDSGLNRMLISAIAHTGRECAKGDIWTTDAIYRETPEKVRRFQELGVLAVDMEISALMAVAAYRSTALAALLVVSDELSDLKWKPGFSDPRLKESTRLAGDMLLDLSKALAGGNRTG